jgi:TP901 family phage tail tape measure protein
MTVATRDLKVTIDAETAKFEAGLERVRRSTMRMEDQLRRADLAAASLDKQLADEAAQAAANRAADMEKLGRGLVAFGAATLAGLGLATKAAIDWESAWAGVRKTVEGSDAEMAALEAELRNLATTLPATHAEIAGVAEAAGQLGVGVNDVAAFTEVMIDLGETTNLSAAEAATALARMANIMGTATSDVDRMGSTIVELGNNSATTEAEIVTLATRLAAAGKMAGLSEADVFAFASTLTSVGVEAEAGGTALSKVFTAIGDAVRDGNDDLDVFARVAGVTVDEFSSRFRTDGADAIAAFVEGLGRMQQSGQSTSAVFDELGLADQRLMRALLSTASAGSLLGEQIGMANQAWDENTALVEEAERRYETSEAKIQLAKNALVDLAIDIGGVLLPALVTVVETGTDLLRFFADLPGPIKTAATVLGTLLGTVALLGGGFLLLAPRLAAAHTLMLSLARTSPVLAGGLMTLGSAAAKLTMFGAVAAGVHALLEATREAAPSVGDATQALLNFDDASKRVALDQLIRQATEIQELGDRNWFDHAVAGIAGFGVANVEASRDAKEFNETIEAFDNALASMVQSGHIDQAAESAIVMANALGHTGDEADAFIKGLPGYQDSLKQVANDNQLAAESAEPLDNALADLAVRFGLTGDDAEKAAQDMLDSWAEASGEFVDILGTYSQGLADKEEAEQITAQATADATKDASDSWEDYATDVTLTLDEYLDLLEEQVKAQQDWQINMVILAGRASAGLLAHLAELGPEGAHLVEQLANGTDAELARMEAAFGVRGAEAGQGFALRLSEAGPLWQAIARTQGQETADKLSAALATGKVTWEQILTDYGHLLDEKVPTHKGTKVTVDTSAANLKLKQYVRDIEVTIKAKLQAFLPSFFGGGGGSGGGAASGGWVTPLNPGTYRRGGGVGSYPGHTGQDLPARTGTPVFAARAGRVSRAMTMRGSYGNHVYIDHSGGLQTRYAHLSARNVSSGQIVPARARIGAVGSTGNSTGPHLHFEIRQGGRVLNPRNYMRFGRGGVIEGPGTGTSDHVPIWASNGEFMLRKAAHDYYGTEFMHAINQMQIPRVNQLASGGPVGPTMTAGALGSADISLTVVAPQNEMVATVRRELTYAADAQRRVMV